jgi:hypothetical protein
MAQEKLRSILSKANATTISTTIILGVFMTGWCWWLGSSLFKTSFIDREALVHELVSTVELLRSHSALYSQSVTSLAGGSSVHLDSSSRKEFFVGIDRVKEALTGFPGDRSDPLKNSLIRLEQAATVFFDASGVAATSEGGRRGALKDATTLRLKIKNAIQMAATLNAQYLAKRDGILKHPAVEASGGDIPADQRKSDLAAERDKTEIVDRARQLAAIDGAIAATRGVSSALASFEKLSSITLAVLASDSQEKMDRFVFVYSADIAEFRRRSQNFSEVLSGESLDTELLSLARDILSKSDGMLRVLENPKKYLAGLFALNLATQDLQNELKNLGRDTEAFAVGLRQAADHASLRILNVWTLHFKLLFVGALLSICVAVGLLYAMARRANQTILETAYQWLQAVQRLIENQQRKLDSAARSLDVSRPKPSLPEAFMSRVSQSLSETISAWNATLSRFQSQKDGQENLKKVLGDIGDAGRDVMSEIERSRVEIAGMIDMMAEVASQTKVINDIALQTKILSFNASIESARAGEYGHGFGVVAEEIGKLAEMSNNAAKDIEQLLRRNVEKAQLAVRANDQRAVVLSQRLLDTLDRSKMSQHYEGGDTSAAADIMERLRQQGRVMQNELDRTQQIVTSHAQEWSEWALYMEQAAASGLRQVADLAKISLAAVDLDTAAVHRGVVLLNKAAEKISGDQFVGAAKAISMSDYVAARKAVSQKMKAA